MPFTFNPDQLCRACPFGICIEDRRVNKVRHRKTKFRLKQTTAMQCTFGEFVPGTDNDPDPSRTFDEYLHQFRNNALAAGRLLFGRGFKIADPALAKVEGDVFELMEAAALWNALAVWNRFMDTGNWDSRVFTVPAGAVATAGRKVAVLKLPRGYDATKLFRPEVRSSIQAHEQALLISQ